MPVTLQSNSLKYKSNGTYQEINGIKGHDAYVYIKYAAVEPTQDSDMKNTADAWIGIYGGDAETAPIHYTDYTWYKIKGETLADVQINGTSILSNGVANIPAGGDTYGVVKFNTNGNHGIKASGTTGNLLIAQATPANIKTATESYRPIVPEHQHESAFYGLSKVAGANLANETVTLGTYPDASKAAIQSMLGISNLLAPTETTIASKAYSIGEVFTSNGKLYKVTAAIVAADAIVVQNEGEEVSGHNAEEVKVADYAVRDVQVNGSSVMQDGVANVPIGDYNTYGVIKVQQYGGLQFGSTNMLKTDPASEVSIKTGTEGSRPIIPLRQHVSTFYGLAKAAGDTTQSASSNAVGTYTDEAKGSIQHMLGTDVNMAQYESDTTADAAYAIGEMFMLNGKLHQATAAIAIGDTLTVGTNCSVVKVSEVFPHDVQVAGTSVVTNGVANVPVASDSAYGTIKTTTVYASGLALDPSGYLKLSSAYESELKTGTSGVRPVTASNQHISTFYGLAKAAGDTTQSQSSNAVGAYTDNAKASIKAMLGIVDGSTGTVDVSGTTPTITAVENTRYVCGEVATLSFTPPASGISIVRFTSGTTATVLTLPSTVKFPEWFDATSLETDTIYEICVTDGVYGAVMSWAL